MCGGVQTCDSCEPPARKHSVSAQSLAFSFFTFTFFVCTAPPKLPQSLLHRWSWTYADIWLPAFRRWAFGSACARVGHCQRSNYVDSRDEKKTMQMRHKSVWVQTLVLGPTCRSDWFPDWYGTICPSMPKRNQDQLKKKRNSYTRREIPQFLWHRLCEKLAAAPLFLMRKRCPLRWAVPLTGDMRTGLSFHRISRRAETRGVSLLIVYWYII